MAKASALQDLSLAQLEKALLSKLIAARETLRRDLASMEAKIRDLSGERPAESGGEGDEAVGRRGRPKGSKNRRKGRRGSRVKNVKSLRVYVQDELQKSKKGLTIDELIANVQAAGYQSKSDKFKNVMYQCLYHNFAQDKDSGKWVQAAE